MLQVVAPYLLTLLLSIWPVISAAQRSIPPGTVPPVAPSGSAVEGQEVAGVIQRVNRVTRSITLDNGRDYVLPVSMGDLSGLAEGLGVKLQYGVDGGRNIVTRLDVQP